MKSSFTMLKSDSLWLLCYAGIIISCCSVRAGTRSSANYTITTDTVSNGGARTTSASYTNDGSVGVVAGISTVASPAETMKHGYIGQLTEVAALQIAASPATVNEGSTRQLVATATLDDTTTSALVGADVVWNVESGPITGISSGGLATAGIVYQNTTATARGVYFGIPGTLDLTVVNVGNDDFSGYANDGIGDDWQVQYFGQPPNANAAPTLDPDGDGQSNLNEWLARTDPTSNASWFRVTQSALSGNFIHVTFPTVIGRSYRLQSSPNLANPWTPFGTTAAGTGGNVTLPVNITGLTGFFFRVSVGDP